MRRVFPWLICSVAAITVGGCGNGGPTDYASQLYRDPAGWNVAAPRGWHVLQFRESELGITSAGVQISNVRLPPPVINPQYPIQVNDRFLTARGVGLIIATDTDPTLSHAPEAVPPLPSPLGSGWDVGSALAGSPYMELLWFRVNHRLFIADAKVGAKANRATLTAFEWIVHSLRTNSARP